MKPNTIIQQNNEIFYCVQEVNTLTTRLYKQIIRRPSTFIASMIQPLLWLLLFGSLFQNIPINLFTSNIKYETFLTPGIIIFTSFNGSIYAGLPLIFDREFGFLNRLMVSPMLFKDSLLIGSLINIITITILQTFAIIAFNLYILQNINHINEVKIIIYVITCITISIASISISLAFILPGHVEFMAILLLINLPTLFSSTALAPLSFMPYWLQILTCLNPLTYAIEILRYLNISEIINYKYQIIKTVWLNCNLYDCCSIILFITILTFSIAKSVIQYKYE
uniref:ABC-2 type transporter n=1 Tax=Campylaephora boydenii TaxID=202204 RepID=UPI00255200E1|nr:ABC-2 type transporter [Campylaephora boydenii]WGT74085.1 ABC-2 type transporter [Campylaephora boydenii]